MGVKFKGKIMSNYFKEVEYQQSITTGIGFCVYSLRVFDGSLRRKYYLGPGEISSVVCTWLNSRMGNVW